MELYQNFVLLKKLPLTIECIHAYDDNLLIGTREGYLISFKIEWELKTPIEYSYKLSHMRSERKISKNPIIQLETIPEYKVLLLLSDSSILIHDLDKISIPFISSVNGSKGATYFSLDINKHQTLSGLIQSTIRLCVVVKYSLLFYYWKNNEFFELRPSIRLQDIAKVVVWSVNKLFIGLKNHYIQVDIEAGTVTKMFPVSSEPLIVPLSAEKNFALCRNEKTYIFDYECRPLLDSALTWTDQPISIANDHHFLIAVQSNSSIEILTNVQSEGCRDQIIQKNELASSLIRPLKAITKWHNRPGQLILYSDKDIVMMKIVPMEQRIKILRSLKHFESAIKMFDIENANIDVKTFDKEESEKMKLEIRKLQALDLFNQFKFTEAISLFQSIDTDPSYIIALFPDILPDSFRAQLLSDTKTIANLDGAILDQGLMALIEYLVEIRRKVNKEIFDVKKSDLEKRKLHELQSIIDTSLLKCYLQTHESLVASLLRIDNHCHLEESEYALKSKNKHNELIILYKTKGLHREALKILEHQARDSMNSQSLQKLVLYLQELGANHLELIFEFSEWILREYPEEGIKIFIDDILADPQYALPRDDVVRFLESIDNDLVITYLDHCIFKWGDKSTRLIDLLINKYRDQIRPLINNYRIDLQKQKLDNTIEVLNIEQRNASSNELNDFEDNSFEYYLRPEAAGQEPGKLGEFRKKLMNLLEVCDHYTTETLSAYLLYDGLFEERAIVLGKMGNHREALMIYVHILNDLELAVQYCSKHYDREPNRKESDCNVFFYLFEQCLLRPNHNDLSKYFVLNDNGAIQTYKLPLLLPQSMLSYLSNESNQQQLMNLSLNFRIAIAILANYFNKIDLIRAIEMLEDNLPLAALNSTLLPAFDHMNSRNNHCRMLRRLLESERLRIRKQRIEIEQANRVTVTGIDVCQFCMKKIGKSVFVRYKNKELVHLGCRDNYESKKLNQSQF
ncbi:Vam6/Vps39-like protein [Sarcoptes scabiei]|uniref:Vam6/Vps39-like protein n=1 Tax=Sarcoptes scabiei TaxID=52283 RepID=A0A834R1Z9_SARSC|nr:Vam6/Vps39-like protein [Sarcoptes scabiei]